MRVKSSFWEKTVGNIKDLNIEAKDKVILVEKLDDSILIKAEVIGVKGIVCLEDESCGDGEIEVKKVDKDEWKKIR
jgi:hypothetical protein